MTITIHFSRLAIAFALLITICSGVSFAQRQHVQQKNYPVQKGYVPSGGPDESDQNQGGGGYQAPPPSGAMEGPSRQLGLSGGEFELPAIRVKMPRIRFPSLSYFITPPRMHIDPDVAPHVQNVQQHVSVPTGGSPPSSNQEGNGEPDPKFYPPIQKKSCYRPDSNNPKMPIIHAPVEAMEIARMREEMEKLEQRLDEKLDTLTSSIEKLAAVNARTQGPPQSSATSPRRFVLLPPVDANQNVQVSHAEVVRSRPPQYPRPIARRLPPPKN